MLKVNLRVSRAFCIHGLQRKAAIIAMTSTFLSQWLRAEIQQGTQTNITILKERAQGRVLAKKAIRQAVLNHFIGAEIIQLMGGYAKTVQVIRNSLPSDKKTRSGDFGEILATEYMMQSTAYVVPVLKLRYKDDRQMPMRGDDVLGFDFRTVPPLIMKTEAKSRQKLTPAVVKEACEGLCRHSGRPNPKTSVIYYPFYQCT